MIKIDYFNRFNQTAYEIYIEKLNLQANKKGELRDTPPFFTYTPSSSLHVHPLDL